MQLNLIHDKIERDVEVIFKIERNGGVPIGCPLGAHWVLPNYQT